MLSILALLAAAIGFSVWHYRRGGYVLQLCVYFNLCALLYMVFGLSVSRVLMGLHSASELERIGWMCVAAVVGFNVAYLIANFRVGAGPGRASGYLPSHTSMLVVVAAGFAFEAAAVLLIGMLEFFGSDRLMRFAWMKANTPLFYLANLMNLCLPIVLARYLAFRNRRDLSLLVVIVVHGLLLSLLTISRYDLSMTLLIGGYFLERHIRIRPLPILGVMAIVFVSMLFYKPVLYEVLIGRNYAAGIDVGEFINWIRHTLIMMGSSDVEMPHGGYGLALKSLFVMRPDEDSLSEWFIKEFFAERLLLYPALGYGFSGVWEGYAANGMIGVAMHFAVFGALFGLLERSPTPMRHVLIVFAIVLTYRLFRSDAYNFVKTYAWYFVYPTFAIVVADKFLMWASGAREAGGRYRGIAGRRLRHDPARMRRARENAGIPDSAAG